MQDRFKFRIWDKTLKQMHYNDFVVTSTGYIAKLNAIYDIEYDNEKDEEKEIQSENEFMVDNSDLDFEKDKILMQCTGLKDKNGKLIYEGDIVKITREKWTKERYNRFYIVCWDRTQWQLGLIKYQRPKAQPNRRPDRKMPFKNIVSFADYTPLKEFALCKVIGNFYENPELLESN